MTKPKQDTSGCSPSIRSSTEYDFTAKPKGSSASIRRLAALARARTSVDGRHGPFEQSLDEPRATPFEVVDGESGRDHALNLLDLRYRLRGKHTIAVARPDRGAQTVFVGRSGRAKSNLSRTLRTIERYGSSMSKKARVEKWLRASTGDIRQPPSDR
jgi:hypothetical protein